MAPIPARLGMFQELDEIEAAWLKNNPDQPFSHTEIRFLIRRAGDPETLRALVSEPPSEGGKITSIMPRAVEVDPLKATRFVTLYLKSPDCFAKLILYSRERLRSLAASKRGRALRAVRMENFIATMEGHPFTQKDVVRRMARKGEFGVPDAVKDAITEERGKRSTKKPR